MIRLAYPNDAEVTVFDTEDSFEMPDKWKSSAARAEAECPIDFSTVECSVS